MLAVILGLFLPGDTTDTNILEEDEEERSLNGATTRPTILSALKIPAVAISTYW